MACSSGHASWTALSELYNCCGGAGLLQQSREALDHLVESLKLEAAADSAFKEQQKGVAKGHSTTDWASAGDFGVQVDASAPCAISGLFHSSSIAKWHLVEGRCLDMQMCYCRAGVP